MLTSGYKAEFGQASGAIVNVITKSGSNLFNGVGSLFLRDDALDASNSLDETRTDPLPLRRHDTSLALGGPLAKDKVFFFGSAEHIGEERQLDFKYPDTGNTVVNQLLREQEAALRRADGALGDARVLQARRARRPASIEPADQLHRQRRHQLPAAVVGQQPAVGAQRHRHAAAVAGVRRLGAARQSGQPVRASRCAPRSAARTARRVPSQTDLTGSTLFNPYDSRCTIANCLIFGNLPTSTFGNLRTARISSSVIRSSMPASTGCSASHDLKFGMNFLRTGADGVDARLLQNQLFATTTDFEQYGAATAGPYLLAAAGGLTPAKTRFTSPTTTRRSSRRTTGGCGDNLTVNLGLRWDYDSEFEAKDNFAPRVGVSWSVTPKTVVRGELRHLLRSVPARPRAQRARLWRHRSAQRAVHGVPAAASTVRRRSSRASRC